MLQLLMVLFYYSGFVCLIEGSPIVSIKYENSFIIIFNFACPIVCADDTWKLYYENRMEVEPNLIAKTSFVKVEFEL